MGVTETVARERSSISMGQDMGEYNNLGIGGGENTGLDTNNRIAEGECFVYWYPIQ